MSPAPASSIIVIGAGAVGMAAIMAAKIKACAEIIVVDLHEARRQTALQIGATHAFDGADPELAYKIQMLTDGGADYAIDAVGITPTVQLTLSATKPGAHIILLGVNGIGTQIPMDLGSIAFNRKVEGAIMGDQVPSATIPQLAKFYLSGQFPFDKLVKYYSFKDINQAINDSESGVVIKPIVTFD
jgi:aryl-alcohol dehydrogenase